MKTTDGHFDLSSPEALFKKATADYLDFFEKPDSWLLFNLLATLSHLLEWICPEADGKQPKPSYARGTPQQVFYNHMWNQSDYRTIRSLCNNSKHFHYKPKGPKTAVINGSRAGLFRSGDSLSQTYFLVDRTDIRDILMPVFQRYKKYFGA
jgi:hypothetical protein